MESSGNGGLRERESKGTVDMEELMRAWIMKGRVRGRANAL